MSRLLYTLTLEAPLLVGEVGNDPNAFETARRVRGSAILGALAARWLGRNPQVTDAAADPTFRRLFLGDGTVFLDANPAVGTSVARPTRLLPMPRSVKVDKHDALRRAVDLAVDARARTNADAQWVPTEAPKLIEWSARDDRRTVGGRSPVVERTMHHVRDREMGRPHTGGIFFYESLARGEVFMGAIEGDDVDLAALRELMTEAPLPLGRSRSARYGGFATVELPTDVSPARWRETGAANEDYDAEASGAPLLVATVLSDCFVRDPETGEVCPHAFGSVLDQVLHAHGRLDAATALGEPAAAFVEVTRVHGHVAAWRMNRGAASAVAAGSVFVFEAPATVEPGTVLRIGDRTHEGYGRVAINLQGGLGDGRVVIETVERGCPASLAAGQAGPRTQTDATARALGWLVEQWYRDQMPGLVMRLVEDSARRAGRLPPAGALAALRAAIARGAWPVPGSFARDGLKRAGLGDKNVDALLEARLTHASDGKLIDRLDKLLVPGGGQALADLVSKLPSGGGPERPDVFDGPPSDALARRFVVELLQALRRLAQREEG